MRVQVVHAAERRVLRRPVGTDAAHPGARLADDHFAVGFAKISAKRDGGPNGIIFSCAPSSAIVTASWNGRIITVSPACSADAANTNGSVARAMSVGPQVVETAQRFVVLVR